ncbi:MAG: hypothetical protein NC117_10045 [Pseudoflavonifractor sp.]|nr:hypothetical protein [Pseudoflavonifractor sp.]
MSRDKYTLTTRSVAAAPRSKRRGGTAVVSSSGRGGSGALGGDYLTRAEFASYFELVNVGTEDAPVTAIHALYEGLYSSGFVSAFGTSATTGSSGVGVSELWELGDVSLSARPVAGQVLTYNGSKWVNQTPTATSSGLNETELATYLANNNYAKKTDIPTRVGQLTNDKGYINTYDLVDYPTIDECNDWYLPINGKAADAYKADTAGSANTATRALTAELADTAVWAETADKLTTARTLWGNSFDGSSNIGGTLTPLATGTYDVGTSSRYWRYAYLRDLIASNSVKIGSGLITWNSAGYFEFSAGIVSADFVSGFGVAPGTTGSSGEGGMTLLREVSNNVLPALNKTVGLGNSTYPFNTGYFTSLYAAGTKVEPTKYIASIALSGSTLTLKNSAGIQLGTITLPTSSGGTSGGGGEYTLGTAAGKIVLLKDGSEVSSAKVEGAFTQITESGVSVIPTRNDSVSLGSNSRMFADFWSMMINTNFIGAVEDGKYPSSIGEDGFPFKEGYIEELHISSLYVDGTLITSFGGSSSGTALTLGAATGSGNAITALTLSNGKLTPTKGATFQTVDAFDFWYNNHRPVSEADFTTELAKCIKSNSSGEYNLSGKLTVVGDSSSDVARFSVFFGSQECLRVRGTPNNPILTFYNDRGKAMNIQLDTAGNIHIGPYSNGLRITSEGQVQVIASGSVKTTL